MPFTKPEFAKIMARLAVGSNDSRPVTAEMAEVYYRLLFDLPLEVVELAAERALLESQYTQVPAVGVLRKLATEFLYGERLTAGEAYELARKAVRRFGSGGYVQGVRSVPVEVAAALQQIGWRHWCDSENPESLRARFIEFYEALDRKEARRRLLPERLRKTAGPGPGRLEVERAVARIGRAVKDA